MEPLDTVLDTWRSFAMQFVLLAACLPLVVASRSTPGEVTISHFYFSGNGHHVKELSSR